MGYAIVVVAGLHATAEQTEEKDAEIARLELEANRCEHRLAIMRTDISHFCSDVLQRLEELRVLRAQASDPEQDNTSSPAELEEPVEADQKLVRECSRVFRKIAMKTHPDRTDDPDLNSMHSLAEDLRARNDLVSLNLIWDSLSQSFLGRLFNRAGIRTAKIEALNARIRMMQSTEDWNMLQHFESCETGKMAVKVATRNMLIYRLEMETRKWQLEQSAHQTGT